MFWNKNKTSIGIEITDSSIKLLELAVNKKEILMTASVDVPLDKGLVVGGVIKDKKRLKYKVREAFNLAGIRIRTVNDINFAIPDQLLYTHVFRESVGGVASIKQLVRKEFQRNIPLTEDNGEYVYKLIDKHGSLDGDEVSTVVILAASRKILLHWQNFFLDLKLSIELFDSNMLAIYRAMFDSNQEEPVLIIDVKKEYTKLAVFSVHGLEHEVMIDCLVKEIEETPEDCVEAIKKSLLAYITKIDKELDNTDFLKPNKVFVCGDNKAAEIIREAFINAFPDSEVEIAKIKHDEAIDSSFFGVLGLAKRSFNQHYNDRDPFLPCIGHSYKLSSDDDRIDIKEVFKNLRTLILIPFVVLIVSFAFWLFLGAKQTSQDTLVDKEDVDELLEEKEVLPVVIEDKKELKQEFLHIKEIGMRLNVRKGPGTSYDILGQVDPGTEQELIGEENGWYNIKWPNENSAWISSFYASKLE